MKNNKILIFGGSGGIGKQLSHHMTNNNYNVISLSSKDVDVTEDNAVSSIFDIHSDVYGVINLVGVNYDGFAHKLDMESVRKMVDINVIGTVNISKHALIKMRKNNNGRIIHISSILSEKSINGTSIYSATKGFMDTFTKNISLENISKGVTCNSIRLGYFDAGMTYRLPYKIQNIIKEKIGLGRLGNIEELYSLIDMLFNNQYISGQNINISGEFNGL